MNPAALASVRHPPPSLKYRLLIKKHKKYYRFPKSI